MLSRFESVSLNECLYQLSEAIDQDDFEKLYRGFHTLKGASGYIGAGRIHLACYFMEEAHREKDKLKLQQAYPLLIEISIEFKRYARKFIADYRSEPYTETANTVKIELAKGYTLQTCGSTSIYYCLYQE